MARDVIRWMQSLFFPALRDCADLAWCPAADVYRTPRGWLVKLDLAGVRPEDLSVRAAGNRLLVTGSRRDCTLTEGCRHYRMEIAYSHFERSFELPCDLEKCGIAAEFRDGMLHLHIQL